MSHTLKDQNHLESKSSSPVLKALSAWLQILLLVGIFIFVRMMPGIPYAGQVAILACLITASVMLRLQGQTWSDLGLRWAERPADIAKGAFMVILIFSGSVGVNALAQLLLPSLLGIEFDRTLPDVSTLPLYLTMLAIIWTTNSFGEEMVMRGFLISRFSDAFGGSRLALILATFAQAALFGLGHAYQGIAGVISTGIVGLVFGFFYLLSRRNLWPVIIAHALINTIGMTVLYLQAAGVIAAS